MAEIVLLKMNMSYDLPYQMSMSASPKAVFKDSDSLESQHAVWRKKVNMKHA